jgi:hypothetical protein
MHILLDFVKFQLKVYLEAFLAQAIPCNKKPFSGNQESYFTNQNRHLISHLSLSSLAHFLSALASQVHIQSHDGTTTSRFCFTFTQVSHQTIGCENIQELISFQIPHLTCISQIFNRNSILCTLRKS